ncbi:MAG: nitroreductase family protein [Pseudomonadota bacterium]
MALAAEVRAVERAMAPEAAAKAVANFRYGGAAVAVIASPRASDKIPDWEQALSAGAVCMQLLTAALAAGWGANWLTGPFAADEAFLTGALGTAPGEYVAGFIHLGRETAVPPERPRPNLDAVVTWID